ncbi:MAG: hypothetical protein BGO69_15760 [Bacteroidetes bacterium 46-16]|nr:MAG: hypothetical protein BGO69_15760 [Bacteroidetes bacterium 46-16]
MAKLKEEKKHTGPLPYAYTKTVDVKNIQDDTVFGVIYETGKGKNRKVMNWSITPSETLAPSIVDWYLKVMEVATDSGTQIEMHFDDVKLEKLFTQILALDNVKNYKGSKRKKEGHWELQ